MVAKAKLGTGEARGAGINQATAWYLGVGLLLVAIYPLLGNTAQNIAYMAIGLAAIAMTLRAIPGRGGIHGAWFWFGVGLALDLAGDIFLHPLERGDRHIQALVVLVQQQQKILRKKGIS